MRKKLLLVLLLVFLAALCSCGQKEAPLPTVDLSRYTVLYNKEFSRPNAAAAKELADALSVRCGGEIALIADKAQAPAAETEYEILVGHMDRNESIVFIETLGENEFGYTFTNNKIVIAGNPENATLWAIELFMEEILQTAPDGGYHNAAELAASGDNPTTSSYNGFGESTGALPIDFIFVSDTDAIRPVYYEVCDEAMVSDHYAVYAELMV